MLRAATLLCSIAVWAHPATSIGQDIWSSPQEPEKEPKQAPAETATQDGDAQEPSADNAGPAEDEQPTPTGEAADPYLSSVRAGLGQTVARDYAAAVAELSRATKLQPQRPEAYCGLGEAQRLLGEPVDALASYRSCARFAAATGNKQLKAAGLVGEALVAESDRGRRAEARDAWQRVLADTDNAAARTLATARVAAIEAVMQLDQRYEAVRKRIRERAEQNK